MNSRSWVKHDGLRRASTQRLNVYENCVYPYSTLSLFPKVQIYRKPYGF